MRCEHQEIDPFSVSLPLLLVYYVRDVDSRSPYYSTRKLWAGVYE
jgi:hypothetical protein